MWRRFVTARSGRRRRVEREATLNICRAELCEASPLLDWSASPDKNRGVCGGVGVMNETAWVSAGRKWFRITD